MENILTLGKLLSLWFCFLLHSILFFISQTSYRTYTIISSYELARPIMGTIFLVYNDITILVQHYDLKEKEKSRLYIQISILILFQKSFFPPPNFHSLKYYAIKNIESLPSTGRAPCFLTEPRRHEPRKLIRPSLSLPNHSTNS